MRQHGQTLIINNPSSGGSSPKGSLSNRFAKIAQSRQKGGVVVVNTQNIETRPGKTLGLGFGTGIHPSNLQASGHRISTKGKGASGGAGAGSQLGGLAGTPTASIGKGGKILGIQTPSGLARAMQERGGGAPESLLMQPNQPIIHEVRRRKGGQLRGAGGAEVTAQQNQQVKKARASPYAAAAASRKGAKKAAVAAGKGATVGKGAQTKAQQAQQAQQAQGQAAAADKGKGKGKDKKTAKGKAKSKPAKATPDKLDSDLTAYMMKHESTASALLDNDLDTYMAERPDDMTF